MQNACALMAAATLLCVIPKPLMKSSMRISPGWIGTILSVVVNDLNLLRSGVTPSKTDPPPVIDPDAVLTRSIALKTLKPIPRGNAQLLEARRRVEHTQLAKSGPADARIERGYGLAPAEPLGRLVGEGPDHGHII